MQHGSSCAWPGHHADSDAGPGLRLRKRLRSSPFKIISRFQRAQAAPTGKGGCFPFSTMAKKPRQKLLTSQVYLHLTQQKLHASAVMQAQAHWPFTEAQAQQLLVNRHRLLHVSNPLWTNS